MKKSFVDKNGKVVAIEIDDIDLGIKPDYDQTVETLISEKYTRPQETAIINNRMAVFDANLLPKEKAEEYNREYYAYQLFREECKKKAREICGITK